VPIKGIITLAPEGVSVINNTVPLFSGKPMFYDPFTSVFLVFYNYILFGIGLFLALYFIRKLLQEKYGRKDPLDYEDLGDE